MRLYRRLCKRRPSRHSAFWSTSPLHHPLPSIMTAPPHHAYATWTLRTASRRACQSHPPQLFRHRSPHATSPCLRSILAIPPPPSMPAAVQPKVHPDVSSKTLPSPSTLDPTLSDRTVLVDPATCTLSTATKTCPSPTATSITFPERGTAMLCVLPASSKLPASTANRAATPSRATSMVL